MAGKKRRSQKLESKYRARRIVLLALLLALLAAAGWILWPKGERQPAAPEPSQAEVSSQPEPVSQAPESAPEPQPEPEPKVATADWNLLLVNSTSRLPDDFTVELESIVGTFQVDTRIANNLRRMINKAREDGIDLKICSAYRPLERQQELFESRVQAYIDQGRTPEEADAETVKLTARPGTSEHSTGLAVDIVTESYQSLDDGYADTPAAKWLVANAADYGFILRYPRDKESITQIDFEPWHYRYVGEEHARAIKDAGYCLEEYLYVAMRDQLQQDEAMNTGEPTVDGEEDQAATE